MPLIVLCFFFARDQEFSHVTTHQARTQHRLPRGEYIHLYTNKNHKSSTITRYCQIKSVAFSNDLLLYLRQDGSIYILQWLPVLACSKLPVLARSELMPASARSELIPVLARSELMPAPARTELMPAPARREGR